MIAAILLVIFTTGVSGNADKTEDTEAEEQKIIGASFASEHASYQQALGNLLEAEAQKIRNISWISIMPAGVSPNRKNRLKLL